MRRRRVLRGSGRRRRGALVAVALTAAGVIAAPAAGAGAESPTVLPASFAYITDRVPTAASDPVAETAADALAMLLSGRTLVDYGAYHRYLALRRSIAADLAARMQLDGDELDAAWDRADLGHTTALMAALTQLGVRYRSAARDPGVFLDCSGLTGFAWEVAGVAIGPTSIVQIRESKRLDAASAQPGDLVQYPGHVMMYLGIRRAMIHAPGSGKNVLVQNVGNHRTLRYGDPSAAA